MDTSIRLLRLDGFISETFGNGAMIDSLDNSSIVIHFKYKEITLKQVNVLADAFQASQVYIGRDILRGQDCFSVTVVRLAGVMRWPV